MRVLLSSLVQSRGWNKANLTNQWSRKVISGNFARLKSKLILFKFLHRSQANCSLQSVWGPSFWETLWCTNLWWMSRIFQAQHSKRSCISLQREQRLPYRRRPAQSMPGLPVKEMLRSSNEPRWWVVCCCTYDIKVKIWRLANFPLQGSH